MKLNSDSGCEIDPSDVVPGDTYEIKIGSRISGWHTSRLIGKSWHEVDGGFIGYTSSVSAIRIPQERLLEAVGAVLKDYKAALRLHGEEDADIMARGRISAETCALLGVYEKGTTSHTFCILHTILVRLYLRFKIHVPDPEPSDLIAA